MRRRRILEQQLVEKRRRLAVEIQQAALAPARLVRLGIGLLLDGSARPPATASLRTASMNGRFSWSRTKEIASPPLPQPKQWNDCARRIDVKRRRLLVVKRAVRPELRARPLQRAHTNRSNRRCPSRSRTCLNAFLGNLGHGSCCAPRHSPPARRTTPQNRKSIPAHRSACQAAASPRNSPARPHSTRPRLEKRA